MELADDVKELQRGKQVLLCKSNFLCIKHAKTHFSPQSGCAVLGLLSDVFGLNCNKMMRNKVGPVLNNKFMRSTHTGNILDTTAQQSCNKSHIYEAFKLHVMLKSHLEQFFPLKFPLWTVYSHAHTALYFVHSKHLVFMSMTNLESPINPTCMSWDRLWFETR